MHELVCGKFSSSTYETHFSIKNEQRDHIFFFEYTQDAPIIYLSRIKLQALKHIALVMKSIRVFFQHVNLKIMHHKERVTCDIGIHAVPDIDDISLG